MRMYLWLNGDITGSNGGGKTPKICQEMGKKTKTYSITNTDYRAILSAGVRLSGIKQNKLKFLTFTFPFDVKDTSANKILTHFLKSLKRAHGDIQYIWTKERQKNGRIHYHGLFDLPFIPIRDLQNMYNTSISKYYPHVVTSNNSLRLPPKDHCVDRFNDLAIVKYMAKYISKERGREYAQPCFSISRQLRDHKREIMLDEAMHLIRERGVFRAYGNENYGVTMLKNCDDLR